jgi:hypothetical protein
MFRKLFKKKSFKFIILGGVFLLAIVLFWFIDFSPKDKTEESIEVSSIPTIAFLYEDYNINLLYGYVQKVDALYMRDTIAPIPEDYTIKGVINGFDGEFEGMSFEVMSIDGENLVQDTTIDDWTEKGEEISFLWR